MQQCLHGCSISRGNVAWQLLRLSLWYIPITRGLMDLCERLLDPFSTANHTLTSAFRKAHEEDSRRILEFFLFVTEAAY